MTHIEELNQELMNLKKDITGKDRKNCMIKLGCHNNTIQNYLSNKGTDPDTAAAMIAFYKRCIEKRKEVLA